jgi:hypothetical protein
VGAGHGSDGDYPPGRPRDEDGKNWARIMWRDVDGDGRVDADEFVHVGHHQNMTYWHLDSAGSLWEYRDSFKRQREEPCGLLRYPLKGFDEHGNPLWDFDIRKAELFAPPEPFHPRGERYKGAVPIRRFAYDAETGRMLISGYPKGYDGPRGGAGAVLACYEHFIASDRRRLVTAIDLPMDPGRKHYHVSSFDAAGGLIFAGLGTATKEESIFVYDMQTGESLGAMVPGPTLYGETSWLDIPQAVNAFRRSTGEIVVAVENNWKNLQIFYRIPPQPLVPGRVDAGGRRPEASASAMPRGRGSLR